MNDRFRFRAFYHNPYEEDDCDNKKMFYEAENTYDYLNGVPASSFGDIINSDFWTVEQCTGLKDKNGKLIYEGDIVEHKILPDKPKRYIVKWSYTHLSFELQSIKNPLFYDVFIPAYDDVIGNIHENPELLKESK